MELQWEGIVISLNQRRLSHAENHRTLGDQGLPNKYDVDNCTDNRESGTDRANNISPKHMVRVVHIPAGHAHQTQKMHWEESKIHPNKHQIEVSNQPAAVHANTSNKGKPVPHPSE